MKDWAVNAECKECKINFLGRIIVQQTEAPKIGSVISSMECPKCKKKVTVTKLFNKI